MYLPHLSFRPSSFTHSRCFRQIFHPFFPPPSNSRCSPFTLKAINVNDSWEGRATEPKNDKRATRRGKKYGGWRSCRRRNSGWAGRQRGRVTISRYKWCGKLTKRKSLKQCVRDEGEINSRWIRSRRIKDTGLNQRALRSTLTTFSEHILHQIMRALPKKKEGRQDTKTNKRG